MNSQGAEKMNIGKCLLFICVIFFLNRIISSDSLFQGHSALQEIYAYISQIITVYYAVKWAYFYYKKESWKNSDWCGGEIDCILVVLIYFMLMLLSTLLNDGNIRRVVMSAYPIIGTLCFVDLESRQNSRELLTAFFWFFCVMICWNLLDAIFVRKIFTYGAGYDGVTQFLLIGRNQLSIPLTVAFSITLAYMESNRSRIYHMWPYIVYLLIILMSAFLSGSATTIVTISAIYILCLFLFLLTSLLKKHDRIENILKPWLFFNIYVVGWLCLVVFRLQYLAEGLIVNVLHRNLTLTTRTAVWDSVLKAIENKPLFGYGMTDSGNIVTLDDGRILSAHNQILQSTYYGGFLVLLSLFLLCLICCSKEKNSNKMFPFLFISVIGILIVCLTEAPGEYALFTMLGMCYYSERFVGGKQRNE